MTDHFNNLSPAEAERLALLAEECGEVIQIVGKILRHGYESRHPDGGPTNRELLEKEIGDTQFAHVLMENSGDIGFHEVGGHSMRKRKTVRKYLHHQDLSLLED